MDAAELLGLVSRWLHILAAIVLVGGTLFMRLVTVPSLKGDAAAPADELKLAMRARWSRLVAATALLLILSGTYNLVTIMKADTLPGSYHMMLGVKLLLAVVIFFLASVLAGRTGLAKKFQQKEELWLNVIALLAIVLVCTAGAMKNSPRTPKDAPAEQTFTEPAELPHLG